MSLAAGVLTAALALPPQGLVAAYDFARVNLLNWSEDLTTSAWVRNRIDTTPNRATVNANPTGFDYVWQAIPSAAQGQTITVYADMVQGNSAVSDLRILTNNGSTNVRSARIRWADRTLIPHPDGATTGTATVQERGDGVLRVTITVTLPALTGSTGLFVYPNGWDSARTPGIYVDVLRWQWQLGAPTEYEKQTDGQTLIDRGVRLGSAPPARSNLIQWSEMLDQWSRTRVANVLPNITTAPDGTLTADKIVPDTTPNLPHALALTFNGVKGAWYTASCYFKAGEYSRVRLTLHTTDGTTTNYPTAWWDVATGTLTQIKGPAALVADQAATITPVGDGWYRCTFSVLPVATANCLRIEINPAGASDNSEYQGTFDGIGGFFAWGGMVNAGPAALPYERITDGVTQDFSLSGRNLATNSRMIRTSNTALPTGWSVQVAAGATAAYSYGTDERGVEYLEVAVTMGVNAGAFNLYFTPQGTAGLPYMTGQTYSVGLDMTQVSGPPVNLSIAGTHVWTSGGAYVGTPGGGSAQNAMSTTGVLTRAVTTTPITLPVLANAAYFTARAGATVSIPGDGLTRVYRFARPQVELGPTLGPFLHSPVHATLGSASTTADSSDPMWTGQGLQFDGVDDFVPVNIPEFTSEMTLIVVARGSSNFVLARMNFASNDNTAGGVDRGWGVSFTADGLLQLVWNMAPSPTGAQYIGAQGVAGRHNYFAYTYRAGRLASFVGGVLRQEILAPHVPVATGKQAYLGRRVPGGYFAGSVAYVAVYDRALTDAEIHQAYRFIRNQLSRRGVTI